MQIAERLRIGIALATLLSVLTGCASNETLTTPDVPSTGPLGPSVTVRGRIAVVNTRVAAPLIVEGPDGVQVTPDGTGAFTLVVPTGRSGLVVAYRDTVVVALATLTAREMRAATLDLNESSTARSLLALSPPTISLSAVAAEVMMRALDGDARVARLAAAIKAAQESRGAFRSDTGLFSGVRTAYEEALPAFFAAWDRSLDSTRAPATATVAPSDQRTHMAMAQLASVAAFDIPTPVWVQAESPTPDSAGFLVGAVAARNDPTLLIGNKTFLPMALRVTDVETGARIGETTVAAHDLTLADWRNGPQGLFLRRIASEATTWSFRVPNPSAQRQRLLVERFLPTFTSTLGMSTEDRRLVTSLAVQSFKNRIVSPLLRALPIADASPTCVDALQTQFENTLKAARDDGPITVQAAALVMGNVLKDASSAITACASTLLKAKGSARAVGIARNLLAAFADSEKIKAYLTRPVTVAEAALSLLDATRYEAKQRVFVRGSWVQSVRVLQRTAGASVPFPRVLRTGDDVDTEVQALFAGQQVGLMSFEQRPPLVVSAGPASAVTFRNGGSLVTAAAAGNVELGATLVDGSGPRIFSNTVKTCIEAPGGGLAFKLTTPTDKVYTSAMEAIPLRGELTSNGCTDTTPEIVRWFVADRTAFTVFDTFIAPDTLVSFDAGLRVGVVVRYRGNNYEFRPPERIRGGDGNLVATLPGAIVQPVSFVLPYKVTGARGEDLTGDPRVTVVFAAGPNATTTPLGQITFAFPPCYDLSNISVFAYGPYSNVLRVPRVLGGWERTIRVSYPAGCR